MKNKFYYYFRVTLIGGRGEKSKDKAYREIAVLGRQTLSTLASTIVRSFNFYFDHCYGFYNNFNNIYESSETYELFTDIPEDPTPGAKGVTYIKVATVFPEIEKKMLFLFDYGDNWKFSVELIDVKAAPANAKNPKIVKKIGKAPIQYSPVEDDFEGSEAEAINDLLLTKSGKVKQIFFAPKNKITDETHQLVKALFNIEGALITNDSILEDFLDFGGNSMDIEKVREMFIEQIAEKFGVFVPEILGGETRIWMVVELINEKQKKLLFPKANTKKRSIS